VGSGPGKKPRKFINYLTIKWFLGANGINHGGRSPKENDHWSGCKLKSKMILGIGKPLISQNKNLNSQLTHINLLIREFLSQPPYIALLVQH
jgi:hypothetical protein